MWQYWLQVIRFSSVHHTNELASIVIKIEPKVRYIRCKCLFLCLTFRFIWPLIVLKLEFS